MSESSSVLVVTLGGQPQIATFALDLLLKQDKVDTVVAVYLPGAESRSQRALTQLAREFPGDRYQNQIIHFRPQPVRGVSDIQNEQDAETVWQTLHRLLGTLKEQGHRLHLCLGGGRRLMGLLSMSAAMLHFEHSDRAWHIYTKNDLRRQANEGALMHTSEPGATRLIQVPLVPWGAYFPGIRGLLEATSAQAIASQVTSLNNVDRQRTEAVLDRLTERETEVLGAFADGLNPSEVAQTLGVAISTIDTHKTKILGECRNAWELPEKQRLDYRFIYEKFSKMGDTQS